jgi:hypothetical protein
MVFSERIRGMHAWILSWLYGKVDPLAWLQIADLNFFVNVHIYHQLAATPGVSSAKA